MRAAAVAAALACLAASMPLAAQVKPDLFTDGPKDAKIHAASGFVCPLKIGPFERDAVGQADPEASADFCTYSRLDGAYGTITLKPLSGAYDAAASLAPDFAVQEGTGGKKVDEGAMTLGKPGSEGALTLYTRSYETSALEDLHYRVLYAGAAFGNWAVETTVEYAEPRDNADERDFLHAVYDAARTEIAANTAQKPSVPPPLAPSPGSR